MRIPLSPLAYCNLVVPYSVALDDPIAVHLFEFSQNPGVIAFHKLDEPAQCELFRASIKALMQIYTYLFPRMRSLTLEVSLQAKKTVPNAPNNPLDRRGITFYIRIYLACRTPPTETNNDNKLVPVVASARAIPDPSML